MLKTYLDCIKNITEESKELEFRTALETFLNAIKTHLSKENKDFENIHITHEPKNDKSGFGAPDFQVNALATGGGALTLGYIENKRVNADLEALINEANKNEKAQIAKYFHLSQNIILTDYLRFVLIRKDEKDKIITAKSVFICDLKALPNLTKKQQTQAFLQDKEKELCELFTLFFSATPRPINTALEFASGLALRSRLLKDSLQDFESHTQISSLYQNFKDVLYKDLDFATFCDSFAQTLTYALFLAKLNDEENEAIDLYNAKKFVPNSFPLIRAMSKFLDVLGELNTLKWLVSEILNIINHIDIEAIIKDLNKISEKDLWGDYVHKDPYLHFYETFLSQYDPNLRELRGVYYTPMPVVSFIINAIDEVLQKDFALQGLKSALDNENITLLDFATGTGTFLLEAFRKVLETLPKSYANKDKIKSLISRFYGFEFLIAPYTIAHLKLSQTLKEERNIELNDNERFNIYLTNTLQFSKVGEEAEKRKSLFGFEALEKEYEQAQNIKEKDILIITGNPPYNYDSINPYNYIYKPHDPKKETKEKYLSKIQAHYYYCGVKENTEKGNKIEPIYINEKNPKGLQDDYVKFIHFAESKIIKQENGIIAIICNNSFLDNPTFRGMRWHLLNSFDKIYILNLHGNARKKESCPDGSKDDNVFDIMQGVCISVFVKISHHNKPKPPTIYTTQEPKIEWNSYHNATQCQLFYYDLWGKRKAKYHFLLENNLSTVVWDKLAPKAPFYLFIPQNESLLDEYNKGWSVKDIFKISSVGITSARDSFCMSDSHTEQSLQDFKQRVARFIELDIESARREFELGKDSRDWKVEFAQNELKKTGNNPNNYIKIHYRPFDYRYTYYTGKSKGFHSMPRGDVMRHFLPCESDNANPLDCSDTTLAESNGKKASAKSKKAKNVGLIYPRQVKESKDFQHAFISQHIIDKCAVSPSSFVAPLFENWIENFTPEFRAFIDAKYKQHFSPETILGYIYAVLHHKDYKEKYLDFLKIDFPKIPFVKNKEKFLELSKLGLELINVHLMRENERERERE